MFRTVGIHLKGVELMLFYLKLIQQTLLFKHIFARNPGTQNFCFQGL